jgi:hypothetical protein
MRRTFAGTLAGLATRTIIWLGALANRLVFAPLIRIKNAVRIADDRLAARVFALGGREKSERLSQIFLGVDPCLYGKENRCRSGTVKG